MRVNIFSHCNGHDTITETVESFTRRFGDHEFVVWLTGDDPAHVARCKDIGLTFATSCLADGYIRAIEYCKDDYCFMLEHDWLFKDNITHSLEEITDVMSFDHLTAMRFNKRSNEPRAWDKYLVPERDSGLQYCLTPCYSNNPHIVNTKRAREQVMPRIKLGKGSKGIEENVSGHVEGAIYGPIGYAATIKHIGHRR